MGIDSNIAMGVKPIQIEDPMNALAKMMQIKDAQQASQLNTLKMDEHQRGVTNQNALRQLMSGFGDDHAANQSKLLKGGFLKESQDYGKSQADMLKSAADAKKTAAETQFKQVETAHKRIDAVGQVFGYVKDNPSAEAALQATDYLVTQGIMTPEQAAQTKARIEADPTPNTIRALATQAYQSALSAKDQLPKLQTFNAGDRQVNQSVNPITGVATETGSTVIGQSADNRASQATAMRGQNMVDSRARETNQISRELGITEKQLQIDKLRDEAIGRAKSKQADVGAVENQIGVIDKALNHKGRTTGTGLSGSIDPRNYIPGTDATDFKVVVDQLGGAAFLQAFESLKGGGQITEREGKKATDAIARLNRSQSDKEFETALKDLRQVMSDGLSRMKSGSATPSGNMPAAPSAPGATNAKGWPLMTDANGNRAYVSPDGKQFEEVR